VHSRAMPDDRSKPPSRGDQYRKRADELNRSLKRRRLGRVDRAKQEKKKKALEDMAANEDWLEGKPGSQLKK
jgi:hypothetical protein